MKTAKIDKLPDGRQIKRLTDINFVPNDNQEIRFIIVDDGAGVHPSPVFAGTGKPPKLKGLEDVDETAKFVGSLGRAKTFPTNRDAYKHMNYLNDEGYNTEHWSTNPVIIEKK